MSRVRPSGASRSHRWISPVTKFYGFRKKFKAIKILLDSIRVDLHKKHWTHKLSFMVVYEEMNVIQCTVKKSGYHDIHKQSIKWCSLWLSWLHTTNVWLKYWQNVLHFIVILELVSIFLLIWGRLTTSWWTCHCQDLTSGQPRLNRRWTSWIHICVDFIKNRTLFYQHFLLVFVLLDIF